MTLKNFQDEDESLQNSPSKEEEPIRSQIVKFFNFSWISFATYLVVFVFPLILFFLFYGNAFDNDEWMKIIPAYFITVIFLYFCSQIISTLANRMWQRKVIENDISSLYEKLEDDNFFTTLIRINFKYIDKYYLQTQVQANKSFYVSTIAAIVSLIIIIVGIVMLYVDLGGANKEFASYITIGAGALGEFIATIFFYLYNRTVIEMSSYHQKLVLTQNISLALRIADQLENKEAKATAQTALITALSKDINMYLTMQVSKALNEETNNNTQT